MKKLNQSPKREHILYINECALAIWSKLDFEEGKWFDCIKEALRQHREYLISCVNERKKIELDRVPKCQDCGINLTKKDVWNFCTLCHFCWKKKYVDSVCISPPNRSNPIPPKPRLTHPCL